MGSTSYWLTSLLFPVNRPPLSRDTAFSKLILQNQRSRSRMSSKFKVTKWVRLPIDSHPFPPCQSFLLFLGYVFFKIWLWKFKVKVTAQGHIVGPPSYRFTSLLFHVNPPIPEILIFLNLTLKIQGQGHGRVQSSKSQSVFHLLSIHIFHSVFEKLQVLMPWISRHGSCLYLLSYFPLKHTFPLSHLPLTSSVLPSFHLGPVPAGIIFHLHAVPSVVLLQCHTSSTVPSIVPLCHPSYTFHPPPSILHRPSVAPSLQPPAPSVLPPHHPPAASSLCPSGAQLNEIWLEVSWISLLSFLNDRHLY